MRSARNQLILLGFVCQGFSSGNLILPLLYALVWFLFLLLGSRRPVFVSNHVESILLGAGCAAGYFLSKALGQSAHFFIGHGLVVLQAIRLLRPLTKREKNISFLIAAFHIAVGCTVVLDFRFILIFIASIYLVPYTLMEMEAAAYPAPLCKWQPRPGFRAYAIILPLAILFFLVFPRGFLAPPFQSGLVRASDSGTFLESVLDSAGGGRTPSQRVILQIQGDHVEYLRFAALVNFDGVQWTPSTFGPVQSVEHMAEKTVDGWAHRRVRVKNAAFLGKVLPSDGRVIAVKGKFFRNPTLNRHGIVQCNAIWNTANNLYEYWTDPGGDSTPLNNHQHAEFTRHPAPSLRLQQWVDSVLEGVEDPILQARALESHFRDHFTYKVGAPELNRMNPLDDFIFNQKEGHCERFASALAVTLRMKGIPSRVMLGYLSNTRNWMSGWHNIRMRDAHAWTEAYFPRVGWITLDATPRATGEGEQSGWTDLLETLDFIWYSKIVNFDVPSQQKLLAVSTESLKTAVNWISVRGETAIELIGIGVLILCWRRIRRREVLSGKKRAEQQALILAEHYYGQMLQSLAKSGFHRPRHLTPHEFLENLEKVNPPFIEEVRFITHFFCLMRYGGRPASEQDETRLYKALETIKKESAAARKSAAVK